MTATYSPESLATITLPTSTRNHAPDVCDGDLGPDPHTPAQRAAIERKRAAILARDERQFIGATAHLPASASPTSRTRSVNSSAPISAGRVGSSWSSSGTTCTGAAPPAPRTRSSPSGASPAAESP